jgi:hypothetical protein
MQSRAVGTVLLLLASCLQGPEPSTRGPQTDERTSNEPERTESAAQPAYEDTFHFTVQVRDDGRGSAGGWQVASADLKFKEISLTLLYVYEWHCPVIVGMPIRNEKQGRISARYAALVTGEVTDEATEEVMNTRRGNWRNYGQEYCEALMSLMNAKFRESRHEILGARVKRLNPW